MLDDMVNKELIPSAMGQKLDTQLDKMDSPEEFKGEDPASQRDAVSDLQAVMQATADAAEQAGSDEAADKMDDMADAADAVEQAAQQQAAGGEGDGPDTSPASGNEEKVKAAVLDLIDATNEKWDAIMRATEDDDLKKSMEYMEKVALAEQLLKAVHAQILAQKTKRD